MKHSGAILLRQRLEDAGYFAAYGQLGDGNFRPYDWNKMASALPETTQALWRFFLLGETLPLTMASRLLGEPSLEFLARHKLCRRAKGKLSMGAVSLVAYRELVMFVERSADPQGYFGDDTKALMTLLPRLGRGRCLNLYPGSGGATLPLAFRSDVETTFAGAPMNRQLINANLCLNEAQCPPRFQEVLKTGSGERYDVILATTPSIVEPPGCRMSQVISGGKDGLRCVREVLKAAATLLAPGGQALMTFIFFSLNDTGKMKEKLQTFLDPTNLNYSLTICSKHLMEPGVPIYNLILSAANTGKGAGSEAAAMLMHRYLKKKHFEAAYLIKARFSRETRPVRRDVMDFSDLYYGGWTF